MRLRRIEIVGFKSFMERTVFTFPTRVTGIVGPNGCGKTNVADAVLWAMGEMRPTHLRSRSMEDVIFNGTETLKPLGMAEVSLVFENDGAIPLEGYGDYSEIMVSRRLFRSGESEYLINKLPCRLKDVRDLFLGTGVGVNAYSIIEQGEVDMLLNARPEDRRRLIEEAAGVTKYKERKRETLLKMERTKQNLLRVQDVIGEVRRQMNALRRQAARARRYREYQKEMGSLEVSLALVEFGEQSGRLAAAKESLQGKRDEEQQGMVRASQTEDVLEELKRRLLEEEEMLSHAQEEIYRIDGEIQREEERVRSLEREFQGLHILDGQYREEIEGLVREQADVHEKRGTYRTEFTEVEQKVQGMRGLLEHEEEKLRELDKRCAEGEEALDALKDEVVQASAQIAHCQNVVEDGRKREREYLDKRARLGQEQADIHKEERDLEATIRRCEEAVKGLAKRKEALGQDFQRREAELQGLQEELSRKEGELKEAEGELHGLRVHFNSLSDMQKRFEGYAEGVKAIMTFEDASLRQGIIGVLADMVEVDPMYEAALEAALGHTLQSLIVKGQEEALEAIRYLKEGRRGRGSFVLMGGRQPRTDDASTEVKGDQRFLGPLADFVRAREEYRPLIEALLDGVWVVKDLAGIKEEHKDGIETLVTMEGDLRDRHGVLTGGSWDAAPTGILARKREIKDTEEAIIRHEEEYKKLPLRLEELRDREVVIKKELEALRQDGYQLEREELRVGGEEDDARRALAALNRKAEVLTFEVAQVDLEAEQLRDDVKRALIDTAEGRKLKEEKEGHIEELKGGLVKLREERDQLRNGVTDLQVQVASLQERERNLGLSLEELDKTESSVSIQKERKEGQLQELQKRRQDAAEEQKEIRESLGRLLAQREQKVQAFEQEGEGVKGLREEIASREVLLKGVRGELKEIQESIAQQGIALSQTEMEMRHLSERITERYGLTLSSLIGHAEYTPPEDRTGAGQRLAELKEKVERLGEVYPGAVEEYEDLKKRYEFLEAQKEDLQQSITNLNKTIAEINRTSTMRFQETFEQANNAFQELVPRLFNGGRGTLVLDESSPEPGVDIFIQPSGKRLKDVDLLSGGEKAMAAIAFIFSLFLLRPTPFCLLDEVDAALDDANIGRFATVLKGLSEQSQFILISHNKGTMEIADALYGITMENPGVSKVVSVKFNEAAAASG
jgi:chromosome segregation protein